MYGDIRSVFGRNTRTHFQFLTEQLEALTPAATWCILLGSIATIMVAEVFLPPTGVRFGPLYLLPVCLASWRCGFRIGLAVAIASGTLTAITCLIILGTEERGAVGNLTLHFLMLVVFATIVASLRNGFDRERRLACLDGMTGALNRPAFEQRARATMALARTRRVPLLLAYIDLDGFKKVNDQFGHETGDQVLQRFAEEGRRAIRQEDSFGRMGGDEFAVMMSLSSSTAAQGAAEKLHARLTAALAATGHTVTSSMGVVLVGPDRNVTLDELIGQADQIMYAVKRADKNGFRLATSEPSLDTGSLPLIDPNRREGPTSAFHSSPRPEGAKP